MGVLKNYRRNIHFVHKWEKINYLFFVTGEIVLARPLEEITAISHVGDPIILTVVAEEVRLTRYEPEAMSTTVQLAFILGDRGNQPPYFSNDK